MPLDPTAEPGPAGLVATHRVVLPGGGYPSFVVCASRMRSSAALTPG